MEEIMRAEQENLDETLLFLRSELDRELSVLSVKREDLKELNKYMWTDYVSHNLDDDRLKDITQLFTEYYQATMAADNATKIVAKYERLLRTPYFGRFDLTEEGFAYPEPIYVGFHNLIDLKRGRVYIHDWRSPIASVYYRFELGPCHYDAPDGRVQGNVELKRHLKIEDGFVKFYVDSGLVIRDEMLMEALRQNATDKMKNIVETIQKEQDLVIRDLQNDVVVVSGVAGSGKTSIALHRVAYLLYESKITKANNNNVLVLSPNGVFEDYIDEVLPSLGEERVKQITLDDVYSRVIKKIHIQTKHSFLERLMRETNPRRQYLIRRRWAFKSSRTFAEILDRYAVLYERRFHSFQDIVLDSRTLFSAGELKALFLDNKAGLPAEARLRRIKNKVQAAAEPIFAKIRVKLREIVYNSDKRAFEEERFTDALMAFIRKRFNKSLDKQFSINPKKLYYDLLGSPDVFNRLSAKLRIPADTLDMLKSSRRSIHRGFLPYEDAGALMYLTERLCGVKDFSGVRHVVIDEAQDYGYINYLSFKRIFSMAKYTILGDPDQAVGKGSSGLFFQAVAGYLQNPKTALLSLDKSYRSSVEINAFCGNILGKTTRSFGRNGEPPAVNTGDRYEMLSAMSRDIAAFGINRSIAVITKTAKEAKLVFSQLATPQKTLLTSKNEKLSKGPIIMPVYLAKGLEFDFVLVWKADSSTYETSLDRNLLYVACTRALHKLSLYAEGDATSLIKQ